MAIPTFARAPSLFQDQSTRSSGLGRWSMSFAFDWSTLPIVTSANINFPLWDAENAGVFDFNALAYENRFQDLGSIRAITFSSSGVFSNTASQFPGELAFFSSDSGVAHRVAPNLGAFVEPALTFNFGFILNGCLPLNMGATTPLTIIRGVDSDGPLRGRFWATVTNYDLPSYLYTGATPIELA